MKAAISSFVKGKIYLLVTEVRNPGDICIVQKAGENAWTVLSNPITINGNMALTLEWPIETLVQDDKEFKLLYTCGNHREMVNIGLDGLLSSLQPMQADVGKELPESIQRIAACTICYNEDYVIKKWAEYYGGLFGYENLFIVDDGSDTPVAEILAGLPVNITRIPRTAFDSWRLSRTLGLMQRVLLETYDVVITSDSDEFLVCDAADPALDLCAYLRSQTPGSLVNVAPIGFQLVHSRKEEPDLDFARPILEQRKYVVRSHGFDKPIVSTVPTSFYPGNHQSYFPKRVDPNLVMLHVRFFDYNFAVNKLVRYQNTAWSAYDLEKGLSFHQRQKVEQLDVGFAQFDEQISQIDPSRKLSELGDEQAAVLSEVFLGKIRI